MREDATLTQWTLKGIHSLPYLIQGNKLKTFSQIQTEYELPSSEYFTFLRIQHCLGKTPLPLYSIPPQTWDYLTNTTPKTKGIAYFYNLLHKKAIFLKLAPHQLWEYDLTCTISDTQWQHAFKSIYKATNCSSLWELTQKISLRWYLTPAKLASFSPKNPNTCWRCKTAKGDMFHIFWTCSLLQKYWSDTFKLISTITKVSTPPSPALALLNLNIDTIPYPLRHTTHVLLAARLNITSQWRSDKTPTIAQIIDLVSLHFSYETITAASNSQTSKSHTQWQPWANWSNAAIDT